MTYEAMAYGSIGVIMCVVLAVVLVLARARGRCELYADHNPRSECLTDNANRTLHKVREILNDHKCVRPHSAHVCSRRSLFTVHRSRCARLVGHDI